MFWHTTDKDIDENNDFFFYLTYLIWGCLVSEYRYLVIFEYNRVPLKIKLDKIVSYFQNGMGIWA